MLYEFPELQALIQQREDYFGIEGKNPKRLDIPSESEVKAVNTENMRKLFGLD